MSVPRHDDVDPEEEYTSVSVSGTDEKRDESDNILRADSVCKNMRNIPIGSTEDAE